MKSRTITTIGIITAILMTVSGAELAFARGGGGGGGGGVKSGGSRNGAGSGANAGAGMSQMGNTNQYQYKEQNQYQYRQDKGTSTVGSENGKRQGNQAQSGNRTQLRDPSTHEIEISE